MTDFSITIAGDSALNIEFSKAISPETSATIRLAAQTLTDDPIKGVVELVPTFCSLMVYYDPLVLSFDELVTKLQGKLRGLKTANLGIKKVTIIPVCYGGELGPDIQTVADYAGISIDEVIRIHSSNDYLIDMLGFLPGFAYLGGLDPRLHTPRLATPRTSIPAGSVGIGGAQTGIYPLDSPGGWQIIGNTPLRPYDPDRAKPILYSAGEYLRFEPITFDEYLTIQTQIASGEYRYQTFVEDN